MNDDPVKNVKHTDNMCNDNLTCIHGFFNKRDVEFLLSLCPGWFTPTFYKPGLNGSFTDISILDKIVDSNNKKLGENEHGYYFTFDRQYLDKVLASLVLEIED